ncbi:GTP-binding protein Rhes-like [Clavelina lepadiformis]|uniref:GTP-binding protein Rhes-like n=1 Tax=Clavelina lepadiformis TaxID=159417 RepID=UPI0040433618
MDNRQNAMETLPVPVSTERKLRLVVLGTSRSGKTQLMSSFLGKPFSDVYIPTIEDFHRKIYTIRGNTYLLDILETSGMNINPLTQKITLMTGDVFLIVYSVTNKSSFEHAKETIEMIHEAKRSFAADSRHNSAHSWHWHGRKKHHTLATPIILAGNKIDLNGERVVSASDVEEYLQRNRSSECRCAHVEVSATDPSSVQGLFKQLFLLSHLPLEMSPNMHRKVTQEKFVENARSHKQSKFPRHHSDNDKIKSFILHRNSDKNSSSSGSSSSIASSSASDDSDCDVANNCHDGLDAIATLCPNQRRPSAATEVSFLLKKSKKIHQGGELPAHWAPSKICTHSTCSADTHRVERGGSPLKKLKQKLSRVTSSHI